MARVKVVPVKIALTWNGGIRKPNFEIVLPRSCVAFSPGSADIVESKRHRAFLITFMLVPNGGRCGFHKVYRESSVDYKVHTACLGDKNSILLRLPLFGRKAARGKMVGPATLLIPFTTIEKLSRG